MGNSVVALVSLLIALPVQAPRPPAATLEPPKGGRAGALYSPVASRAAMVDDLLIDGRFVATGFRLPGMKPCASQRMANTWFPTSTNLR